MKIGILGTRGIPNRYGGFEQFAEIASQHWVSQGHEVWVYCGHTHEYRQAEFKGVKRISIFDPEFVIGTAGQFFYDLGCILDARTRGFDVLLQLGYTSSSVWSFLLPSKPLIVTNMDGLEWKRAKFSPMVQQFLRWAESRAVSSSDILVADSLGIQSYLKIRYNKESEYIAYGADMPEVTESHEVLQKYQVEHLGYNLVIARMEPENNIEMILEGMKISGFKRPTLVVGNTGNGFGTMMKAKYGNENVRFLGGIYNIDHLNVLRKCCYLYYHGHSVGGTNPSLLEAMALGIVLSAHQNEFNSSVLESDGLYFTNAQEIAVQQTQPLDLDRQQVANNLISKIQQKFSWDFISSEYLRVFHNGQKKI
jgi:glycosyltransferase involved in cell wall biosynthesis